MFTTTEQVKEITGYDVTIETIGMAQAIVEGYVGRLEVDISNASDLLKLGRATAYQAAYMLNDPMRVFEQMSVAQISQFGANITFKAGDKASPWVAPLAQLYCTGLSWRRMRSIKTGSIFHEPPVERKWVTD